MPTSTQMKKIQSALGDTDRKNIRNNVWGLASYLVDVRGLDEAAETAHPETQKNYKAVATILLNAQQELNKLGKK